MSSTPLLAVGNRPTTYECYDSQQKIGSNKLSLLKRGAKKIQESQLQQSNSWWLYPAVLELICQFCTIKEMATLSATNKAIRCAVREETVVRPQKNTQEHIKRFRVLNYFTGVLRMRELREASVIDWLRAQMYASTTHSYVVYRYNGNHDYLPDPYERDVIDGAGNSQCNVCIIDDETFYVSDEDGNRRCVKLHELNALCNTHGIQRMEGPLTPEGLRTFLEGLNPDVRRQIGLGYGYQTTPGMRDFYNQILEKRGRVYKRIMQIIYVLALIGAVVGIRFVVRNPIQNPRDKLIIPILFSICSFIVVSPVLLLCCCMACNKAMHHPSTTNYP